MNQILIGAGLIVLGALIFGLGRRRSDRLSVRATSGSVAVGGNSSGPITNITANRAGSGARAGGRLTDWLGLLVGILGVVATVWGAMRTAGK
jgi:hypothetical protein